MHGDTMADRCAADRLGVHLSWAIHIVYIFWGGFDGSTTVFIIIGGFALTF
jgi:hypothetical protein